MSPTSNTYTTASSSVKTTQMDRHRVQTRQLPYAKSGAEDRRPIHRLRRGLTKDINAGLIDSRVATAHGDIIAFRDGFLSCAAVIQSYIRRHPRLSNWVKDDLLIHIHHCKQVMERHGHEFNPYEPSPQPQPDPPQPDHSLGHCPMKAPPCEAMTECETMTSSHARLEPDNHADEPDMSAPLYMDQPELLSGVGIIPGEVITCRHCEEREMEKLDCRFITGENVCTCMATSGYCSGPTGFYGNNINANTLVADDSPQAEAEDLTMQKCCEKEVVPCGGEVNPQEGFPVSNGVDVWRPWGFVIKS